MSPPNIAAARLRHGLFCTLVSSSLLWSSHAGANTPPTISGTPPTTATDGKVYTFTPRASDADGNALSFSVKNKPDWASFSIATGTLSGTPVWTGTDGAIVISVSDGHASASLPSFSITVSRATTTTPAPGTNTPPTISGTPSKTAIDGKLYTFTPKASDANGDTLSFSIKNKPDWATFSSRTGTLSGTPVWTGTDGAIAISVSDGHSTVSLASFSITVTKSALPVATSSVTINWTPPTENVDGSTLTNLAGYHLYYGTSSSSLTHVVNITNPGLASYVVSNLSAATWYFSVTSINSKGTESPRSAVVAAVVQ
jgi:hypothetical protein